jgi:hypothetical protein
MKRFSESPEDMMPASPDEKSMALRQAKFIEYVAEEIEEYLDQNRAFPEWMQNKLSAFHQTAKDMHAVLAGEYEDDDIDEAKSYGPGHIGAIQRMLDKERGTKKYTKPTQAEIDADRKKDQSGKSRPSMSAKSASKKQYSGMMGGLKKEDITKMSHGRLKFHMNNKSVPHGSHSFDQMKAERDRRLKTGQGDAYKKAKSSMSESYINEKLSVSQGMSAWIDDFKKSDAPQFKGKSDKERRDMAIAAYLNAKKGPQNEKFVSAAQRKAVWATKADGGKGHPDNKGKK